MLTSAILTAAALKYFKACIKTHNHFIHRHLAKNDLMLPLLGILEQEAPRDNMLTATCLEITEMLRHVSRQSPRVVIVDPFTNVVFPSVGRDEYDQDHHQLHV